MRLSCLFIRRTAHQPTRGADHRQGESSPKMAEGLGLGAWDGPRCDPRPVPFLYYIDGAWTPALAAFAKGLR